MDPALLAALSQITAEEQAILDGHSLDMSAYTSTLRDVVDLDRLMGPGHLICVRPHTRFTAFPLHWHDFVEILYMASGSTTHRVGGRTITLRQGELLFLGRNTRHEIAPAGREDIGVNFLVRPAFFHTAFALMDGQSALSDFLIHCLAGEGASDEYLHFAAADLLPVQNLVENLIYSLVHQGQDSKLDELTMGLMLLHLLHAAPRAETGGVYRALALQALSYIDLHYADATLSSFARLHHVPDYTASRAIKVQLGATFQTLLQDRRLSAAAQMLSGTDLAVSEIISSVGYENTSYFHRAFRERYGKTPREYRQANCN